MQWQRLSKMQFAALQYKDADYSKVDEAITKANALNKDDYKNFTAVENAIKICCSW